MGNATIQLNGFRVDAFVVEQAGGLRVDMEHDEWLRLGVREGRLVPLRMAGRDDVWVRIARVIEIPPFAMLELRPAG
jgi:hypothetical protein